METLEARQRRIDFESSDVLDSFAPVEQPSESIWVGYISSTPQPFERSMKKALWYLIAGTRGGRNRARIIRSLDEQPRNANQLATVLDVEYNTIRHHLDLLVDHGVIEEGEQEYGKLYFLTEQFEHHRQEFESITDRLE